MEKYTKTGPCAHCDGTVTPHGGMGGIIYWCDTCGGNNPSSPPSVKLTFTETAAPKEKETSPSESTLN